ncbi:ADP-ribose glycohydrolase OARD1 [Frankliniella fusca]|uniref:ADP-ribose glycohydrolase OARD1 n=1 Tax=Frankliniella fusca TaxID=407009 RepID=A0AAE1HN25_9NEOP|nr:ADP-ribose glycohydrolase OARD1 [Frankliniella fusca]
MASDVSLTFTPRSIKRLRSETYASSSQSSSERPAGTVKPSSSTSATSEGTSPIPRASPPSGPPSSPPSAPGTVERSVSPDLFDDEETITAPGILAVPHNKVPESTMAKVEMHHLAYIGFKRHCLLCNGPGIDTKDNAVRHMAKFHRNLLGLGSSPEQLLEAMKRSSVVDAFVDFTKRENIKIMAARIVELWGDVFAMPTALAHAVSADLHMGAGIAVGFKEYFGKVDELKQQDKKFRDVAYIKHNSTYIFYLITKERYSDKNISPDDVLSCLVHLSALCVSLGVEEISMPRLGCGLDLLKYYDVLPLIHAAFFDSSVRVNIITPPPTFNGMAVLGDSQGVRLL